MARRKKARIKRRENAECLESRCADYLEWMAVKNYAAATLENRSRYLRYFVDWCDDRGLSHPDQITQAVLEGYQRYLFYRRKTNGQPLSTRSQYARLVPVRALFKYLARQHITAYNPAAEVELPKLEKRLPKAILTKEEAEAVLAQPDLETDLGLRDRAILEVFYSTGLRRSEVVDLSVGDVDSGRGTVMVRQGKGKKDRMIPIGERAAAWVTKYVLDVRPSLLFDPAEPTLFLTTSGERFTRNRMSQLVRNYVDAADIGKRGSCHLFRHTMATLMLEHGADIRFIQAMLGHVSLETTQIYTQVSVKKLAEVHARTHPGARLGGPPAAGALPQTPPGSSLPGPRGDGGSD